MTAEEHRGHHQRLQFALLSVLREYEGQTGRGQGSSRILGLLESMGTWRRPQGSGWEAVWKQFDECLACYISTEGTLQRHMTGQYKGLSGTTLDELMAWNARMGTEAEAQGEDEDGGGAVDLSEV